ncbi:MAG TPA: ATP-binding protein [Myxococcaceae bacterium]|jgi:PAS domain S-box-containing protein
MSLQPPEPPPEPPSGERTSEESLEPLSFEATQSWRMSDDLPLGLYLVDTRSGRVLYANHHFFQLWHIEPLEESCRRGEGLHATVLQHCLPAVADAEAFLRRHSPEGGATTPEPGEDELALKDGRTLLRYSSVMRDARGAEGCWLYVFKDITERKRTEQALQRSETTFRQLIESSPDGVCVHRNHRYVYANPTMLRAMRFERESDLIGRHILEFIHPDDREAISQRVRNIISSGQTALPQQMRTLRSDGTWFHTETVAMPIEFDGQPSVLVMGRDITERKQMEAQLLQADRMVVMGTLAAGVGHEINNPLTYVLSNLALAGEEVEQLARELEQQAPALEAARGWLARLGELKAMLAEAHSGADRVRTIVKDLKVFSRQGEERRTAVNVREVVEFSIKMSMHEVRSRARLVTQYDSVPEVLADGARLGQVFLNLLVNAAQAIPEGNAEQSEVSVRVRNDASGRVAVDVSDTGTGIPPEVLPRIFEPFYTTKPVGSGTGLGLSICHSIVRDLGGELTVRTELGRGSTFTVLLPLAPSVAHSGEAAAAPVEKGRHRVLIIDDEPAVGRALARMLGKQHTSTVVENGQEALAKLLSGESFDAVFCDLMMPGLSGMDLYERLQEQKPELTSRFIFMTGGAYTPRARTFLETVPNGWLEKPFDAQQLHRLMAKGLPG